VLLPKPEGQRDERPREGAGQRFEGQRERSDRPRIERNQGKQERTQETGSDQGEQ